MVSDGLGRLKSADDEGKTMATLQQEAKALGDPTRHAIFEAIAEAAAPVGVAQLNERFPLNHNAIRQHLAKLVDAGLILETKAPSSGRGRPRLLYAAAPSVAGRWGTRPAPPSSPPSATRRSRWASPS
jgi:DNA-binding transcriptional ArsR family regulator